MKNPVIRPVAYGSSYRDELIWYYGF